ncbi:serine/threonine-protein kinase SRPK3 [Verticillium alfalfae VaMs.102]|uniref:non-specific serine/threonine protein kinase n=1 Tax=Verticillium alfalfae (strain VaMs.102 / ATCC MYA-4576 / FGSC 10136) TaxID=526221 RepID=C9SA72_VERA1|nr:serine/threonine-protein kinase SRPK3 [Verticillium alfalfae VaMs.102]EEY16285.1 serine/threonine-protein kinase SRPK3 [Verticillium alfalfae VaMs.102]
MASFLRKVPWSSRVWKPLTFPNPDFLRIPPGERVEEELFPDYKASRYYPVIIGQVLKDRYQIVGKLCFGASSAVWLARDLEGCRHVALKLFIHSQSMGEQLDREVSIYRRISNASSTHPGRGAVRELLDSFDIAGPEGSHRCLVHPPLWENLLTFLHRNPVGRLPVPVLAFTLRRMFQALDFLHTDCQVVHTDIKADNIMFGIEDDSVFTAFEEEELSDPSPRKTVDAVVGEVERLEDVQPDIYRAPEVIVEAPWSYSIDIWNTGCVIWDPFEGGHLFTGHDPESERYRSRAHLAEIIDLLGPPPQTLLQTGRSSHKFFTDTGCYFATGDLRGADAGLLAGASLEEMESSLEGDSQ